MKPVIASTIALCILALTASARAAGLPAVQAEAEPGVWCGDFLAAKAYAEANNRPMLVFWANYGCPKCEELERAVVSDAFTAWQAERQLVMVFSLGTSTASDVACKAFVKNSSGEFPYMGVYWPADTSGQEVLEKFTGRSGAMGHGANAADALDVQLMTATDNILAGWNPAGSEPAVCGGRFLVADVPDSRLEAIAGKTASVAVPLIRDSGAGAATNELRVAGVPAATIVWRRGETDREVVVDTSAMGVGETLALELLFNGEIADRSAIHGVDEGENAPRNPRWLGEAFGYGEWTVDYEAARDAALRDAGSKLVVMFSGPLWCPYCIGIEDSLLATREFRAWAQTNRVYLVLMEQGRATTPASAMGERGPRLITFDPDPKKLAAGEIVSGAAYRSRKGVAEADAQALMERTARYTAGWLAPGSTAARLGNPTILLVDPVGETVEARFNGYREGSSYDVAENLARLDCLLARSGMGEADQYPATTTLAHRIGGETRFGLDVAAPAASYALVGEPGVWKFAVAPDAESADVFNCTLYRGNAAVAVGTNGVSATVSAADIAQGMALHIAKTFAYGERTAAGAVASSRESAAADNGFAKSSFKVELPLSENSAVRGTLTVTGSRSGRVSARYFDGVAQKTASFAGKWPEPDDSGIAALSIEKLRGQLRLRLWLAADGTLQAEVDDLRDGAERQLVGSVGLAAINYADYAGLYTVALPVAASEGDCARGIGYAVVHANTAAASRTGRVAVTVVSPAMASRTVYGRLVAGDGGFADLTLTVRSGYETTILPLAIRPLAAQAATHRAVVAAGSVRGLWSSRDRRGAFAAELAVYGSIFDRFESLIDCCGAEQLRMRFYPETGDGIVSALGEGAAVNVSDTRLNLAGRTGGLSLSYLRTGGTVSGRTRLELADGRKVVARFRGVVLRDWYDCSCFEDDDTIPLAVSLPPIVGTCTFTDRINGRAVVRGIPFSLAIEE